MKVMVLLSLLFILRPIAVSQMAVILVAAPPYTANAKSQDGQPNTKSGPGPTAAPSEEKAGIQDEAPRNSDYQPPPQIAPQADVWVKRGVLVNSFLALVTLLIAISGFIQAKAARLNAQNLANSERAKMVVAGAAMGHSIQLSGKNVGRVAAGISYTRGFVDTLPYGQGLPKVPKYIADKNREEVEEWVSPGDCVNILKDDRISMLIDLSDPKLRDAIRDKKITVWAYARICYRDGISEAIRETRFCFSVVIQQDGYPVLVGSGLRSYNRRT